MVPDSRTVPIARLYVLSRLSRWKVFIVGRLPELERNSEGHGNAIKGHASDSKRVVGIGVGGKSEHVSVNGVRYGIPLC